MNILFVCLGNICRSPMAEGIFNKLLAERDLESQFSCDSAGTAGYHIGELPDFRTRKVCEENNEKLSHRGRKISKADIDEFDLLLAMDEANYYDIIHQLSVPEELKYKVKLIRSFEKGKIEKEIPDPYYGNLDDFHKIHSMLEKACADLLEELTLMKQK